MRVAYLASIAVLATLALGLPVDGGRQSSNPESKAFRRSERAETPGDFVSENAEPPAEAQRMYNGCMERFVSAT